jgi:hypothetical protein
MNGLSGVFYGNELCFYLRNPRGWLKPANYGRLLAMMFEKLHRVFMMFRRVQCVESAQIAAFTSGRIALAGI